ncbi:MAG: sulfatase [Thermoleophilaceae bacterium]|nr:sulfatase [Thermoleophilaceae bacterium]
MLTDDQDTGLTKYMPRVRRRLESKGVSFANAFASYPLCCPSRATLLSGQYADNHGVLANEQAGELDLRNSLPVWLKRSGYLTSYIGKFLNGYPIKGEPLLDPPGWDDFASPAVAVTDMYHYKLLRNGALRSYGSKHPNYKTDVLGGFALESLQRLTAAEEPFFMTFAPTAPHAELHVEACNDPRSSPASRNRFREIDAPRKGAFNETKIGDKPRHVRAFPELDEQQLDLIDCHHRARARSVLDVDRYVGQMLDVLERAGELDNTFVIFTSDNGFLTGQHRIPSGKVLPYDEATRVPLIVRGPGIPEGIERRQLVSNVDWAATILDIAGARSGRVLDGLSLLAAARDNESARGRELLLEAGRSEPYPGNRAPAYQALRTSRWLYVEYEDRQRELYDVRADPDQANNLAAQGGAKKIRAALRERLDVLRDCAGAACRVGLTAPG